MNGQLITMKSLLYNRKDYGLMERHWQNALR